MDNEKYMKIQEICNMQYKLQGWANAELEKDKESIDTKEMGDVIDMIKDLADAKKSCLEAMYYESVIDAMNDAEAEYRMGYGRSLPAKMHKRYPDEMMYKPFVDQEPYIDDYLDDMRYGYNGGGNRGGNSGGSRGGSTRSGNSGGQGGSSSGGSYGYHDRPRIDYDEWTSQNQSEKPNSRYGTAYNQYREMRRHYTQTSNPSDKEEMNARAQEHMADTVMSIRDIWKGADPDLKRKMKSDLQSLMSEMS